MIFTNPTAIWGTVIFLGLMAVYLFKRRSRKYRVSTLIFFGKSKSNAEGGQKFHKPKTPFIFFLEMLIFAFLLLAMAEPVYLKEGRLVPVSVILDDSISMQASDGGFSPREQAVAHLEKTLFSENLFRFTLIKAGTFSGIIGKRDMSGAEAREAIKKWKCDKASSDITEAISRVFEISSEDSLIVVVTDHLPQKSISDKIKWFAFGKPLENLAITSASRASMGSVDRCFFEFTNFSYNEKKLSAVIINIDNGKILETIEGSLKGGESRRVILKLREKSVRIKAQIKNDAVGFDNEAVLLPTSRRKLKVSVDILNEGLKKSVVKAIESSELARISYEKPDAYITDKAKTAIEPVLLKMEVYSASQPVFLQDSIASDKEHYITADLPIENARWAVDGNMTKNRGSILLSSGNIPVLWIDSESEKHIFVGFNYCADYSTVANTNYWPVLFYNILDYASRKQNGPVALNYRAGSLVEVYSENKTGSIIVTGREKEKEEFPVLYGKAVFKADKSGIFDIKDKEKAYQIAVNLCSYEESDLRNKAGKAEEINVMTNDNMSHFESARWWFVMIAFMLMVIHQWLVSSRRHGYAF